MSRCIFCEIVAGTRPAAIVVADGSHTAILDHRPLFPGHVLVLPDRHHETIEDLPAGSHGPLFTVVSRIAAAVRAATGSPGTFIAINNVVSQSVPHVHVHVVPRRPGDSLRGFFWPRTTYTDDTHLERVRSAIARHLGGAAAAGACDPPPPCTDAASSGSPPPSPSSAPPA